MSDIILQIETYMSYPFIIYALIVGILIALSSSLLGSTFVLKKSSFACNGLSNVAFAVMSIATVLNIFSNTIIVMFITILAAILLFNRNQKDEIKRDSAVNIISVGSVAIGYLILSIFNKSSDLANDVCSTLFGTTSILELTKSDILICTVMSLIVVVIFIIFYNKIFAITFDEEFAKATGVKTGIYSLLISIIVAIVIVLAMKLVGSLLISAIIILPSLSSMKVIKSFKGTVICSTIISIICAIFGMIISILLSIPVGPTITVTNIVIFIVFSLFGSLIGK